MLRLMLLFALTLSGAPALAADVPLPSAASSNSAPERVIGSGRIVEEKRDISGFAAIRISGPVNVELRASSVDSVVVKGDDNLLALITTRILTGERPVLEIGMRPATIVRPTRAPTVIVEFRKIEDIAMSGSGNVRAERITGERFALSSAGSGDARITELETRQFAAVLAGSGDLLVGGNADEQAYRLDGSGDVNAAKLHGRRVKVAIAGSGDAIVHATEALDASVQGSGDVIYIGSPRVTQRVEGSGEVRRRN